ncbi:hypothetical protein [Chitinophaga fulva]|nr:hypothetical protein [Chitinophaga fulva]
MIVIEAIFEAFEGKTDALLHLCQRAVTTALPYIPPGGQPWW